MKRGYIIYPLVGAFLFLTPTNAYDGGITSRGVRTKQDRNWESKSPENNSQAGKAGRKVLDKLMGPYSPLLKGAEKVGKEYDKYQKRKPNTGRGTGVVRKRRWK